MSVNLEQILVAGEARQASVAGEVAGYLILAAADELLRAPREFSSNDLVLDERGSVTVQRGRACDSHETAGLLRECLGELLGVSRPLPPALLRATRRSGDVAELIRELEAALIPVNRAAARRALSRLHREVTLAEQALGTRAVRQPRAPLAAEQPRGGRAPQRAEPAPARGERAERGAAQAPQRESSRIQESRAACAGGRGEQSSHKTARARREQEPALAESRTDRAPPPFEQQSDYSEPRIPLAPRVPVMDYPVGAFVEEPEELTSPQPIVARRLAREFDEDDLSFRGVDPRTESLHLVEGDATERVPDVGDAFSLELEADEASAAGFEPPSAPLLNPVPGSSRVEDRRSDVHELLTGFQVAEARTDEELSRALKAMVGMDLTPIAPEYR